MKLYSISKWTFTGICLLILTLPLSRHWELILRGERASGTVTEFTTIVHKDVAGVKEIRYVSEVQFEAEGKILKVYGPSGYEYTQGRSIRLIYNPADPAEYCLLTFTGFYLNNYLILPITLLIVWAAFYLSYNSYTRRNRASAGRDLAFSPYKSRRKSRGSGAIKLRKLGGFILPVVLLLTGPWTGTTHAATREVTPSMGTSEINQAFAFQECAWLLPHAQQHVVELLFSNTSPALRSYLHPAP